MMARHCNLGVKVITVLLLVAGTCSAVAENTQPVRISGGHMWAFPIMRKLLQQFCQERDVPIDAFTGERWSDSKCIERFVAGGADVLVHYALTDVKFGGNEDTEPITCERFIVGQA